MLGGALLKLPFCSYEGVTWSDALFMSASAVTVTGLGVVDIASTFTPAGEAVIAMLIQLGGLGLMVFAVFVLAALGLPVGLGARVYLREDLNQTSLAQVIRLTRIVVKVVLVCELSGAAALYLFAFERDFGLWAGLWHSLFHAVSAFNNAGMSTLPHGLVPYAGNLVVNIVIPALFITGGIGYVVVADMWKQRKWRRLSMHSKLMLCGTAALIIVSVLGFAALEWTNPRTLGPLGGPWEKMLVSWFQGVTTRTAGFNTTDIGGMEASTTMMFIALMMIGGGPASTAGGVKVTTFIVMLIATVAFFRRQGELSAFGRSIALTEILKVTALLSISLMVVFTGIFILTLSHRSEFIDIAFEVASAFGTVGLSRGATAELDTTGRLTIMLIMFLGRVGPLTLGFFLATRSRPRVRYPAGDVILG